MSTVTVVPERVFQPARLRDARRLRGMLQNGLAEALDITPAAISQYEAGASRPSPKVIERMAIALGCAPDWFYRPPLGPAGRAFFRSLRAVPQRERARAEVYALSLGEVFSLIEELVELPVSRFSSPRGLGPLAGRDEIEHAATRLRATWGVPPGPVANVVRLLEASGAVVAAVGAFDPMLDAFSVWPTPSRPVVVLCSEHGAAARRRFDAAHELGHLILHSDATNEQWQEQQAHRFAASLLMPADEVEPWLPRRSNDIALLQEGSRTWGVSMQALLYRGRELGSLSEPAYQRAMRRISVAGWRSNEPVALGPAETPTLLHKAIEAYVESGHPIGSLAERFGVPEGRLLRMLSLPEDRAAMPPGQVIRLPRTP